MLSYNKNHFLSQAIESVIGQDYEHWELLISDDCSTDQSWETISRYSAMDRRIRVFRQPFNLGIPKNRAFAAGHATGDLVCHLDCDDLLYPWSLSVMRGVFSDHPMLAFAYSDYAVINNESKIVRYGLNSDYTGDLATFGWRHFGMYQRHYAEQLGGYNQKLVRPCEDGDLVMQMADRSWPIGRVPYVLYMHRFLGDNASSLAGKCSQCDERNVCNYHRIWSLSVSQ